MSMAPDPDDKAMLAESVDAARRKADSQVSKAERQAGKVQIDDFTAPLTPRETEDVTGGQIASAGATSEAIETDYWFLNQRQKNDYRRAAIDTARELGVTLPSLPAGRQEMEAVPGNDDAMMWDEATTAALLDARRRNPDAFADVPITEKDIQAQVSAELGRQWKDAQGILERAPGGFWNSTVPEFLGRMGTAATDEVNTALMLPGMVMAPASFGRMVLFEAGLGIVGEAATLPKQFAVSERLGTPEPNAAAQLAFAGIVSGGLAGAIRGVEVGGRRLLNGPATSNRELLDKLADQVPNLPPVQRGAYNAVAADEGLRTTGPSASPDENVRANDDAAASIDSFEPPPPGAENVDAGRVDALTTRPALPDPPPRPGASVQVIETLGPGRPSPPDQAIIDVATAAAEDTFGPGAKVILTSGQEIDPKTGMRLPQVGSNRHGTGLAVDLRIMDPDGNLIDMHASPELMQEFARNAARRGATGIGFGQEYMGGAHIHIDMVPSDVAPATAWGSGGVAMREELAALRGEAAEPRALEDTLTDFIRDAEAFGSFDTASTFSRVPPPRRLTSMTLDEVDAWQSANAAAGAESTAAGGFQIIQGTLQGLRDRLGLTGSEVFDETLQRRLGAELMKDAGLERFRAGEIDADTFADNLAGIWAAFPTRDGQSVYAGDGLNAATVQRGALMAVVTGRPYRTTGNRGAPIAGRVRMTGLQVNARDYQFRSAIDGGGVTRPMDRVTEWDALFANDVVVHERSDGTRYIADGHHRHQLARRLESEGHAPIEINAIVYREDDGWTVPMVRAQAALKNIAQGTADAIDAAKVLRVDPDMIRRLSLRQAQERDAAELVQLSDESFELVTNGLVDPAHAAVIPALTREPEMQDAILRALLRMRPKSIAEARQIANDAYRAGLARRTKEDGEQGSLFGDDWDAAETLFAERAKVLARALTKLRNDKRVFATLLRERARITSEGGNVLDDTRNTQRLTTDEQALELVERLVSRAGPVDDALNDAARAVRSGTATADAVADFVGYVRGRLEDGGLASLLSGAPGERGLDATPDGPDAPQPGQGAQELDLFGETPPPRAPDAEPPDPELEAELEAEVDGAVDFLTAAIEGMNRNAAIYADVPPVRNEADWNDQAPRAAPEAIFPPVKKSERRLLKKELKGAEHIDLSDAQARLEEWKAEARRMGAEEDHSDKVILSLFDATGSWSRPFEEAGFRVLRYDVQNTEFQDVIEYFPTGDIQALWARGLQVYGVLSACPCTTFASSGARWWKPRHDVPDEDMVEQMFGYRMARYFDTPLEVNKTLAEVTRAIVEFANPSGFHVLENPRGRIRSQVDLPESRLVFDPHHFGDPYTKETQLFGSFNEDLPTANVDPTEGSKMQNKLRGDRPEDKIARSTTPEGFAYAFFMANRPTDGGRKGQPARRPAAAQTPEEAAAGMTYVGQNDAGAIYEDAAGARWFDDGHSLAPQSADADADARLFQTAQEQPEALARATETTAAGEQTLIEGVAPVSQRDKMQAAQDAPKRGKAKTTRPADEGLFDTGARAQTDMFSDAGRPADPAAVERVTEGFDDPAGPEAVAQADAAENAFRDRLTAGDDPMVPTGRDIDGQPELRPLSEAMAELDQDREFLEVLDACKA